MTYTVYVLEDPTNKNTLYVGCAANVKNRYSSHISHAKSSKGENVPPVLKWIHSIIASGNMPVLKVVCSFKDKQDALKMEENLIKEYKSEGFDLKNIARSNGSSYSNAFGLGISQSSLWKIYNGYIIPGKNLSKKLVKVTGKDHDFWKTANLRQIQKILDSIRDNKATDSGPVLTIHAGGRK